MKEEQHRFLILHGQLPARLTVEQAAWVLNCQTHDTGYAAARIGVVPNANEVTVVLKKLD